MSNFKNRVQLIGHLGAEPELKVFENGGKVCRLRIATNEGYKNSKGEWVEDTQWHSVTVWEQVAERAAQHCTKGSYIMIEGKLTSRSYVDAQGIKKYVVEVRGSNFLLLDKKINPAEEKMPVVEEDDGLPF